MYSLSATRALLHLLASSDCSVLYSKLVIKLTSRSKVSLVLGFEYKLSDSCLVSKCKSCFLAAKGAARGGLMCGVRHTYANVIFIQSAKVWTLCFLSKVIVFPCCEDNQWKKSKCSYLSDDITCTKPNLAVHIPYADNNLINI